MNTINDKMETHYNLDDLGEAEVGKHYSAYRGSRGVQKKPKKIAVSIRLDADVIEAFKAKGKGWQTQVNNILRKSILNN